MEEHNCLDQQPPGSTPASSSELAGVRPPTAAAERLTALLEVLLCSDFPTQILVSQVLVAAGLHPFTPDGGYSATFLFALSILDSILLVGLVLGFLHLHGERPRDVLFGRRRPAVETMIGLLLIPVALFLGVLLLALVHSLAPSLRNVARNPLEALIRTPHDAVLFAGLAILAGGVREEVQRAFILHRFDRHLGGGFVGLVLFSLVFGAGHVVQGWNVAIATAALGAFWGALYLVRRSVVAPFVSHAGFNVAQIIYTLYGR